MKKLTTELYIHIPFCEKKCEYCDFLSAPAGKQVQKEYVRSLLDEIANGCHKNEVSLVTTIFIGGGTPSVIDTESIARIMDGIYRNYPVAGDAEISMECNPKTVTRESLETYRRSGINRISFGLQSANREELRLLGRIHTYDEFRESFLQAREAGFSNINIDVMSALPGQNLESFRDTLHRVVKLNPEHISAYSLIIEEGTPFYERYREDDRIRSKGGIPRFLPDEETERAMYEETKSELAKAGYLPYEISNYAKAGYECRHNMGYWQRENYLGFGLGAASLFRNIRYKNTSVMETYLSGEKLEEKTELSVKEQMEEFMFLGLRLVKGIKKQDFYEEFAESLENVYKKVLQQLYKEKLLDITPERIILTPYGRDISNYVLAQFLLEERNEENLSCN